MNEPADLRELLGVLAAAGSSRPPGNSQHRPAPPTYGAEALQALECLDRGVVFVDRRVRMLHLNREAIRLLEQGEGLRAEGGCLVCDRREDAAALRRLVGLAASGALDGSGLPLPVRRGPERRPLSVHVSPLARGRHHASISSAAVAMVFVRDAEMAAGIAAATLARLYGLTAAEARVAESLLHHEGLAAIAASLRVGPSTVRTLLQRAFAKTGTHRQVDLVRLMLAHGTSSVAPAPFVPHRCIKDFDPVAL